MGKGDWSENVQTHWTPAPGFFEQSAQAIAEGLQANSDSYRQAMDRLDFYINRAGRELKDPQKFEKAKAVLRELYGRTE